MCIKDFNISYLTNVTLLYATVFLLSSGSLPEWCGTLGYTKKGLELPLTSELDVYVLINSSSLGVLPKLFHYQGRLKKVEKHCS